MMARCRGGTTVEITPAASTAEFDRMIAQTWWLDGLFLVGAGCGDETAMPQKGTRKKGECLDAVRRAGQRRAEPVSKLDGRFRSSKF
jgi:hypothetical protein